MNSLHVNPKLLPFHTSELLGELGTNISTVLFSIFPPDSSPPSSKPSLPVEQPRRADLVLFEEVGEVDVVLDGRAPAAHPRQVVARPQRQHRHAHALCLKYGE